MATSIPIPGPLRSGRFIDRPNRFTIRVAVEPEDAVVSAQLADPAPLAEVLAPGRRVWIRPVPGNGGGRNGALAVIGQGPEPQRTLVGLEPALASPLVARAIADDAFEPLDGWSIAQTEVVAGRARFDFSLETVAGDSMMVHVEPVTCVGPDGIARHPEDRREHATRVLRALAEVTERTGWHATLILLVLRGDARGFVSSWDVDPDYAEALWSAHRSGVRILARRCAVTLEELTLGVDVPVHAAPGA